ncbi:protein FAM162B-like [Lithobates pipiens]
MTQRQPTNEMTEIRLPAFSFPAHCQGGRVSEENTAHCQPRTPLCTFVCPSSPVYTMSRLSLASVSSLLRNVCAVQPGSRPLLYRRPYSHNTNDLQPKVIVNQTPGANQSYRNQTKPTDFDKKVLVWAGRYKRRENVPEYVSVEAIANARGKLRIRICMAMIVGTLTGCLLMVWSGKKAVKEEQTLLQRNIERKAKWKEEVKKEAQ